MLSIYTLFEVFRCTGYEDMKGGAKCTVDTGWYRVMSRSWAMSPFDAAHTCNVIGTVPMRLSCTIFEI